MSRILIIILCFAYAIISITAIIERRGWLAIYWISAALLNIAVLNMDK